MRGRAAGDWPIRISPDSRSPYLYFFRDPNHPASPTAGVGPELSTAAHCMWHQGAALIGPHLDTAIYKRYQEKMHFRVPRWQPSSEDTLRVMLFTTQWVPRQQQRSEDHLPGVISHIYWSSSLPFYRSLNRSDKEKGVLWIFLRLSRVCNRDQDSQHASTQCHSSQQTAARKGSPPDISWFVENETEWGTQSEWNFERDTGGVTGFGFRKAIRGHRGTAVCVERKLRKGTIFSSFCKSCVKTIQ